MAARADWQKAAGNDKPGEMLPLLAKMFTLIKSMNFDFSTGQISVATGGAPIFTMGGFGLDFAMKNTDQPKVNVTSTLHYDGALDRSDQGAGRRSRRRGPADGFRA